MNRRHPFSRQEKTFVIGGSFACLLFPMLVQYCTKDAANYQEICKKLISQTKTVSGYSFQYEQNSTRGLQKVNWRIAAVEEDGAISPPANSQFGYSALQFYASPHYFGSDKPSKGDILILTDDEDTTWRIGFKLGKLKKLRNKVVNWDQAVAVSRVESPNCFNKNGLQAPFTDKYFYLDLKVWDQSVQAAKPKTMFSFKQ